MVDNNTNLQNRLEILEMTVAHHEQMHIEMEKTMHEQVMQIQLLERKLQLLSEYIKNLGEQGIKKPEEEIPPPHY